MYRLSIPSIDKREIKVIEDVFKTGFLVQGKKVAEFEVCIQNYLDIPYAVAVNSGTSALHLALIAAEVQRGDEVIIPDLSFPATANVIELIGARPVIVDIEPSTYNIDPTLIENAVTKKTRAIMPVHLFGQSADMAPILKIAHKYKLLVIEDAACVLGSRYKGRFCGTWGDLGCFSFHPRKVITTGEGGVVVTRNKAFVRRLRLLRNHGMKHGPKGIDFSTAGYNNRLTEFQAAMGLVQMSKLENIKRARQKGADLYNRLLKEVAWIKTPECPQFNTHIFQSYVIELNPAVVRAQLIQYLKKYGIEAGIGTYAMHRIRYYQNKYRLNIRHYPVADRAFEQLLSLPLYKGLSVSDIKSIVQRIKQFR